VLGANLQSRFRSKGTSAAPLLLGTQFALLTLCLREANDLEQRRVSTVLKGLSVASQVLDAFTSIESRLGPTWDAF
jgi:hypothetical protein